MKNLEFHPAADIFPMMDGEPFDELVEDVRRNGLQVRIELYEGKILDGRNRYKACVFAGRPVLTTDVDDFVTDPVAHVVSLNRHRRHLTKSQLAIAAGRAESMYEAEREKAKERQRLSEGRGKKGPEIVSDLKERGDTRDKIGQQFGISGPLVTRGRKVVNEGAPELAAAVERGVMDVSKAAGLVRGGVSLGEQKRIAEEAIAAGKKPKQHNGRGKAKGSDGRLPVPPERQCSSALQFAGMAITTLDRIQDKDPDRFKAFDKVERYLSDRRKRK